MKFFDANVSALESSLEQAPEVFESVGVDATVNVTFGMVNDFMLVIPVLEHVVGREIVGVDRGVRFDVAVNFSLDNVTAASWNHHRTDFSATFKNPEHRSLVLSSSRTDSPPMNVTVHVASRAADESFVYFDFAAGAAEFEESAALHRKTNPMEHEPRGLLGDAECASYFVGTDSVLAVGNHPNGDEPLVERNRGILHDGSDLDGKLPMVMDALALPLPLILEEHSVLTTTGRAGDFAIGPSQLDHEFEAVVGVCEVDDGLLECSGLGCHGVPHNQNNSPNRLIRQLYYCP